MRPFAVLPTHSGADEAACRLATILARWICRGNYRRANMMSRISSPSPLLLSALDGRRAKCRIVFTDDSNGM